jgi:uncharacterized membrane protein
VSYQDFMEGTVKVFELVGVAVLLIGGLLAFSLYFIRLVSGVPRRQAFDEVRSSLGRAILLGLEVLVVADIIRTIVVTPILLSFSIDVEVDGILPWRRGAPRGEIPPS